MSAEDLADFVPSNRSTKSSRKPGKAITGTVWTARSEARPCPKCGRLRTVAIGVDPGPHARRYQRLGSPVIVDCSGEVVP